MLPCYVLLDLETTGGNPVHDRVTEIAAVRIENGTEVARWSTLVHPGTSIPSFIQNLTGITNEMVADAPSFSEVASQLLEILEGAVLVAHNVRFDHGFLLNEFARLERSLQVKTLCTVRLSRKLYPQHRGHGLDAIMQRHGLQTTARHRAMGDVDVVQTWLAIASGELGTELIRSQAQALLQSSAALPSQLETPINDIPASVGVYLFYGEGPLPLYIGKSVNLRSRVMSHFQATSKQSREMRIALEIRRIEWIETAGELTDAHALCPQALGLESGNGRCFAHQIGRCKGVCCGQEKPQLHYLRLQLALAQQRLQVWPYPGKIGLREHNPQTGRTDIHIFDQWCHLATVHDELELEDALGANKTLSFDLDTYRLLLKQLQGTHFGAELLQLADKHRAHIGKTT